jgi:hypothetical protein
MYSTSDEFFPWCPSHPYFSIRVVLQRAGTVCARPLKGGVWPSLPANASDGKDSFSTTTGTHIDRAHQPTRAKKMVGQILHSRGKQLLPPFFTAPDVRIGCVERQYYTRLAKN